MQVVLAFVIGGLYAAALYLMLRRSLAKLIVGLALLTNAANLLIFTVGGLTRAAPPIVPRDQTQPIAPIADPLPQALILTAIVIGFGVLSFMMVLAYRTYQVIGSEDLDELRTTDEQASTQQPNRVEAKQGASEAPPEPAAEREAIAW